MKFCFICGAPGHYGGPKCPGYELQKRQDPFGLDKPVRKTSFEVSDPAIREATASTLFLK